MAPEQVQSVTVLGGGTAGFMAAITLRRRVPWLKVCVVRSLDHGIIGVGEGTTPFFPTHLHDYLKIGHAEFYQRAMPQWKLGIRLVWGPRGAFNYTFPFQTTAQIDGLDKPNGYYCGDDFTALNAASALMDANKAFVRLPDGTPRFTRNLAYHIENAKLVEYLEWRARADGVEVIDGTVGGVTRRDDGGVASLQLDDGRVIGGDLFVDASGFRNELLGRAMGVPWLSYGDTLLCDRAVVGGWERTTEPIQAYTVSEQMDAGWCWRIDHEHIINRGYVFSSRFLDDHAAAEEYRRLNPRVSRTRVVPFRTGRMAQMWAANVAGVGNASGFVEPLEATAIMIICLQCKYLAECLRDSGGRPSPTQRAAYNRQLCAQWDEVRDFLALHYRFNVHPQTPFWETCRRETPLHGAQEICDYYQENGPGLLHRDNLLTVHTPFGLEGYWTILLGQNLPHQRPHRASGTERELWNAHRDQNRRLAARGVDAAEALACIRRPDWRWQFPAVAD